jgi:Protein of unknown function (DUF2568)
VGGGLRALVLVVRFVCEVSALAALAYWGAVTEEGALALVLAIAAPPGMAAIWGLFVAPKALRPIPAQTRLIVEFFLFGFASLALAEAGQPALAIALAAAAFGTSVLNASQEAAGAAK